MAVTIVDVARRAGVSVATVSRVMHGSPLVGVETRTRVERAVADLNYAPNVVARGLVMRRTQAIGLVITSLADPFFPPIVQGVEETALNHGYSLLLCTSGNDQARELAVVRLLRERRVDAIVVASSRVGSLYHAHLRDIRVPVVLVNNEQSGGYAFSVGTDDVAGGHTAVCYLLERGHGRVAYIHGPMVKQSTHDRYRGYERALAEAGLPVEPGLVVFGDGRPEGGERAMTQLLQSKPRPTAVFCFNDLTAIGALRAARSLGLQVPRDVSVIGYDDIALAPYTEPPLTTIAQQTYELGRRAMLLALDLLDGKTVTSLTLPAVLVERSSCAPWGGGDVYPYPK